MTKTEVKELLGELCDRLRSAVEAARLGVERAEADREKAAAWGRLEEARHALDIVMAAKNRLSGIWTGIRPFCSTCGASGHGKGHAGWCVHKDRLGSVPQP